MFFSKFKLPNFRLRDKFNRQCTSILVNETNVNEEYMEAFRTKSYIEIYDKVQNQLGNTNLVVEPSSLSSHDRYVHLCDILLEPQEETLIDLNKTFKIHFLLLDFFDATLEAWKTCQILLQSVHQANANSLKIKRVIKLAQKVHDGDEYCNTIFEELNSYSSLYNPLSNFGPQKFPHIYNNHKILLNRMTSKCKMVRRKRKLITCLKKVGGCTLVVSYAIIAIALLVLACHSVVGIIVSPSMIACSLGFMKGGRHIAKKKLSTRELKRLDVQLDVAAKGIYTLIKDFDTMGWLVGRLYDEVEFGRAMARKCVANRKHDVLQEAIKGFRIHESCLLEQLEELEDHIYLCLLNVNRSRRLLVEEIMH